VTVLASMGHDPIGLMSVLCRQFTMPPQNIFL
jgi:hypothetical protein